MSKLFEDAGIRGKRKWQCFVCGKQYKNFETYKEHIIDKHEEGREFIICPTCGAPVRDIRAHFRAKHPQANNAEKLPNESNSLARLFSFWSKKKK